MKLYEFDDIDASLKLVPLAARRALDAMGAKLSLEGFQSLPIEARRKLTLAGSGEVVEIAAAQDAIAPATPGATGITPLAEPDAQTPPHDVREAFGPERPLSGKVWQELSALDRYALAKVAQKRRPERLEAAYREIVGATAVSTHLRPGGGAHMVSISKKAPTLRQATAECWITMNADAFQKLVSHAAPKGDVLGTARLAGIMATKKTSDMIPLCHPIALEHAEVVFEEHPSESKIRVLCSVAVEAKTGVEMEAMVGANIAALTVYDMLKSIDRAMLVGPTRLLHKAGGRSGTFSAEDER